MSEVLRGGAFSIRPFDEESKDFPQFWVLKLWTKNLAFI